MDRHWAERLAHPNEALSRREQALIDFISSHPHEAVFLKQSELSDRAGVSKPVVISCFRSLGYEDYQQFLDAARSFYAGPIDSAQASTVALRDIGSVSALVTQALKVEVATLETLGRHLDPAEVEGLARALLAAGVVYLYAEGTGFSPAQYLAVRLRRCGLRALVVGGDRPHVLDDLAPVRRGDVFLSFCYTQDPVVVAGLLGYVEERGGVTVVITGTPDPELYRRAHHHLFVPRGQWNFKNSMAAPMAFAQILLLAVEFVGGAELHDRLEALEATRKGFASREKGEES